MVRSDTGINASARRRLARRREHRVAERLVLRHEEPAGDEPLADHDAAEDHEARDGEDGVERDRADVSDERREHLPAAPSHPRRGRQRAGRDRPRFVAREARERERPADQKGVRPLFSGVSRKGAVPLFVMGAAVPFLGPFNQHRHRRRRRRQQHRLGHRRRLQIEHVRVEREHDRAGACGGGGIGQRPHDPHDRRDRDGVTRDRDRDRGRAGPVKQIELNGNRVDEMRQRQPDGADLLPARRDAVDDPARDDEMSAGVVVTERQTEEMIMPRRDRAADSRREPTRDRRCRQRAPRERYNHLFILWADSSAGSARSR